MPRCGPDVGTTPRTPCLISVSPQAAGSCEGQRHNVTSRMHLTCTSGSVGDLGGRPPRSTRPLDWPFFRLAIQGNYALFQCPFFAITRAHVLSY